eukprot:m.23242 g.23242  ORF g.23242 m.23242 type:complete len:124 (+) comp8957_c0_seq1:40-411(+)
MSTLSGYVSKQGKVNTGWKRRWLALFTGVGEAVLQYHTSADTPLKGTIDMGDVVEIVDGSACETRKSFPHTSPKWNKQIPSSRRFAVIMKTRTYFFQADSALEAEKWVKGLQEALTLCDHSSV